jgi:hypothetical protein
MSNLNQARESCLVRFLEYKTGTMTYSVQIQNIYAPSTHVFSKHLNEIRRTVLQHPFSDLIFLGRFKRTRHSYELRASRKLDLGLIWFDLQVSLVRNH